MLGKVIKPLSVIVLIMEGPDAFARTICCADQVEGVGRIVREAGEGWIREKQNEIGRSYRNRGGFSDRDLAEYGLDY